MIDLISRQDVIDAITQLWDWETVDGIRASTVLRQVIADIKTLPSAQTKKGKWIQIEQDKKVVPEGSVWWRCSCCNSPALEGRLTMYCPNCGADMRAIEAKDEVL